MNTFLGTGVAESSLSALRASVEQYGFGCLHDALDAGALTLLQQEANASRGGALRADDDHDVSYRSRIAPLGACARALLTGNALESTLERVFGSRLICSETASCFTYYESGDFLSAHRDRPELCEITVLIYLYVLRSAQAVTSTGLQLNVYGDDRAQRLALVIPTQTGTLVLGRGAAVLHERPPLSPGETVVALTSCFRRR